MKVRGDVVDEIVGSDASGHRDVMLRVFPVIRDVSMVGKSEVECNTARAKYYAKDLL